MPCFMWHCAFQFFSFSFCHNRTQEQFLQDYTITAISFLNSIFATFPAANADGLFKRQHIYFPVAF